MRRYTLYNRITSRLVAVVMAVVLVLCLIPAAEAAEYEGTCGANLSWSFSDGTLTITGYGDMTDYSSLEAIPWYSLRDRILRLELPDGLTRVGDMAFYGCSRLTAVTIPAKVRVIGKLAFCQCTGLSLLRLQSGLEIIGESAFEMCESLQDLRLPGSVKKLSRHAFYGCAALATVEIPYSVEEMGSGVFAHCVSLIRAVMKAPLAELPRWTFYGCISLMSIDLPRETKSIGRYSVYGCENLMVIYYGGEPGDAEELMDQISEDQASFGSYGTVTEEPSGDSGTFYDTETDENGDVIVEDTTVTQTEESTIIVTESENVTNSEEEDTPTDITATVVEEEGWEQVQEVIEEAAKDGSSVNVIVYDATGNGVPNDYLDALSGRDITMTVIHADGSKYILDFNQLNFEEGIAAVGLDLSYVLTALPKTYPELEGAHGYGLTFNRTVTIYAEMLIQLPIENARKSISLYQVEGNKLRQLQATVADENGIAHFYLASVDQKTEYVLGIDVPSVRQSDLLIPDTLKQEYGITEQIRDVDYVITGRRSSWGMSFLDVNKILIGFMLSTAAIVGLLMYARNKRKLRQGVIPGWEDDEDDA